MNAANLCYRMATCPDFPRKRRTYRTSNGLHREALVQGVRPPRVHTATVFTHQVHLPGLWQREGWGKNQVLQTEPANEHAWGKGGDAQHDS